MFFFSTALFATPTHNPIERERERLFDKHLIASASDPSHLYDPLFCMEPVHARFMAYSNIRYGNRNICGIGICTHTTIYSNNSIIVWQSLHTETIPSFAWNPYMHASMRIVMSDMEPAHMWYRNMQQQHQSTTIYFTHKKCHMATVTCGIGICGLLDGTWQSKHVYHLNFHTPYGTYR